MITAEEWRPIGGLEGKFEISNFGQVRRVTSVNAYGRRLASKFIKPASHKRLVLEAFVGPCPPGMVACHWPDRDTANCRLDNLRWDTEKANAADAIKHGTKPYGEKAALAKATWTDVERCRDLRRSGALLREIAEWIGILTRHGVAYVLNGHGWVDPATRLKEVVK